MPHPIDVYVGSQIRHRRTALGLSQSALGAALGVSFQQIQKYERGVNRIGASRLWKISQALHVPVSALFEGYAAGPEPAQGAPQLDLQTASLIRAYRSLGPKTRLAVRKLVVDLAETDRTDPGVQNPGPWLHGCKPLTADSG